jgi:hypothetical protein
MAEVNNRTTTENSPNLVTLGGSHIFLCEISSASVTDYLMDLPQVSY